MTKRRLFLLYGQSNMCDRGQAALLPVGGFPDASRAFVYHRPPGVGTAAEIGAHGTWAPATGVIDPAGAAAGQVGALALGFMQRLCELFPDDEVGVVPRSIPATGIDSFVKWNRISGPYGMALERMWWAKDELPPGIEGEISGVVWWQGEQDAIGAGATPSLATGWSQKFGRLVSDIRTDLQRLDLPVAFVKLGNELPPAATAANWAELRKQQDWMTMRGLSKVVIDDLPTLADNAHYDTARYITIGTRVADAIAPNLT